MSSNAFLLLRGIVLGCFCSIIVGVHADDGVIRNDAIIKSENDTRDYELLTLENGLQALLVSDNDATKAAAALDVNVGAEDDPRNRQGLAHFLEHMLFLGTKKYPESGEYQEFINAHGGTHNAYTSFEHTNYFFDVDASHLREALQRFAQFFVAPLFTERYVEREMNAVESEYRSQLRADGRRSLDVFQQVINPEHPFSKLSVGNLQTLNGGGTQAARDALLKFYRHHYSAHNMRLVVIGREPIAELRKWVKEYFSAVPEHETRPEQKEPPLFSAASLPEVVIIKPEKDVRNLSVTFPIPPTREYYKSKPVAYIGNIIGHEGEGSLLSYLKQKDWAEQLSAGLGFEDDSSATFNVSISLTEAGLQHHDEVIKLLFQTIKRIDEQGIQAWMFKEQAQLLETRFRFKEKSQAINYASSLANDMHYYPPADLLQAEYLMQDYRPKLIAEYLGFLTPDNVLITLMTNGQKYNQRSPWYDTPYSVVKPGETELESWRNAEVNAAIVVPEPNPFVPEKFDLPTVKKPLPHPVTQDSTARTRLWWMPDSKFKVPKAQAYFNFHTAQSNQSVRNAALSQLYTKLLQDSLNEFAYPATLAGLELSVQKHLRGISIKVGGYSDKQDLLLQRVATAINMEAIDPQRFATLKKELIRNWLNARKQLPYIQLLASVPETLIVNYWPEKQLVEALQDVSVADVQHYKQQFLRSASIDALVYGNLKASQAKRLTKVLRKVLLKNASGPSQPSSAIEVEIIRLDNKTPWQRPLEIDNNDTAMLVYQQGRDRTDHSRALLALTMQLIKTDFFQQLRTEQQLGYVVFADEIPIVDVPGIAFVVQSPVASGAQIYAAIEQFLQLYADKAKAMQVDYFGQQKSALISDLREQPKNLRAQASRYWDAIAVQDSGFDQRQRIEQILDKTSLKDWQAYFQEHFVQANERRLLLWSAGDKNKNGLPAGIKTVQSLHEFKLGQPHYQFPATME